jgi:hypothetical protein
LRAGEWLKVDRVLAYAGAMILVSTATITWMLAGHGLEDPAGRTVGTDFVSFWTVSWALLNGHLNAIYVPSLTSPIRALWGT